MSSDSDLISVVIPCYNQAQFLSEAIESVLGQTYSRVEILVVDDGSTDDPAAVVRRYRGVRYLRQGNRGPSAARNTGLAESKGSYLLFLDGDDRLLPDGLEIAWRYLRNSPFAFVSGHCAYIAEDGSQMSTPRQPVVERDHYLALLQKNYIWAGSTVLHHRDCLEAVNGYDPSRQLQGAEDLDLYLRIAREFPVFCHGRVISEYRQYRRGVGNVSGNVGQMLRATLFAVRKQRINVKANPRAEQAYQQGLINRKRVWGDLLLDQIKAQFGISHQRSRAIRGVVTLMRYDARGALRRLVDHYNDKRGLDAFQERQTRSPDK